MLGEPASTWQFIAMTLHLVGAIAAATVGAWLIARRERFGPAGTPIVVALFVTSCWSLTASALGEGQFATALAEAVRNLAWLVVIYRLFASDGRLDGLTLIRPVIGSLVVVAMLELVGELVAGQLTGDVHALAIAFDFTVMLRLLLTVGTLVLLHNLYAGASGQARAVMRWPAAGLAVLWVYDLNLFTVAYLSDGWPQEIAAARGLAVAALALFFAVGASRDRDALRIRPSRVVTFQTVSLMVIGGYLVAMVTIAQWLSFAGGDFARLAGMGFLTFASAFAILVLPSRRLRGWLRVTLAKHLFQHRYDYREEWLRLTRTIGDSGDKEAPLGMRVVKAVADVAESPAGLLLSLGDHGDLVLGARWQWPGIEVPAVALPASSVQFFEHGGFIAHLDDLRAGCEVRGEAGHTPQWLLDDPRAWALVPLIHYERLVGVVVLARPPVARRFDWEDFDLLRVVGQQLASYLSEHAGQEALAEASRFDDFHRRIAFVMHDIKNLASQLSLLARNAEVHADKPEFRDDMLVTLRNSADKLNALLARLSRYGGGVERVDEVAAGEAARSAVERFRGVHPVALVDCRDCTVRANRDSLEQVLVHLIQNAVDASAPESQVFLSVTSDGANACLEVADSGCGMAPEFVRTRLFKPFDSSKQGGFGIGAFEARELVRAMGGRLDVESREGLGSRFVISLPLARADALQSDPAANERKIAS